MPIKVGESMELFKLYGSILVEDKAAMNSLQKVDKEGSKLAGGFSKLGGIIAGAFSVAAIVGFGKKVVEASANLQAMEAQFDQVFKGEENSQAVGRITKQVDDLGIHADRLTGTWNKFGGQVKGAGMEGEKALTAVDKATRLAADGAAFYDKSLESSSDSLASFMKGNFAAGDAIGVFTNAKQMDVKSNEMYGKSWADLTESERQWLLLDTVEKTYEMNGAMGQAARESTSYENVMGNLRATFERLWAVIGEPVLEIFLGVVQKVTKWIEDNMPAIEKTVKSIFIGIKEVWNTVLEPVLTVLWDVFKGILNFVVRNWPTIKTVIENVFDGIKYVWDNVLKPVFDVLLDVIGKIVNFIKDNFPGMQTTVKNVFDGIGKAVEGVIGIFDGVIGVVKDAWNWLTKWNDEDVEDKTLKGGGGRSFDTGSTTGSRARNATAASGLSYVPIDGYITELHRGERILTAKENQAYSNNGGNLASQIIQGLINAGITKPATIVLDGKAVGKGLIKVVDNGLNENSTDDRIGKGALTW